MRNLITVGAQLLFGLWVYVWLSYGYESILYDFLMHWAGEEAYLSVLYRFIHVLIISYIVIFYTTYRSFKQKVVFIDMISIALSLLFLYESIQLIYENYYRNYINVDELNSFVRLIEKYGAIVNMFYIFPLILAILYAVFVAWLYFKFKHLKKD